MIHGRVSEGPGRQWQALPVRLVGLLRCLELLLVLLKASEARLEVGSLGGEGFGELLDLGLAPGDLARVRPEALRLLRELGLPLL